MRTKSVPHVQVITLTQTTQITELNCAVASNVPGNISS